MTHPREIIAVIKLSGGDTREELFETDASEDTIRAHCIREYGAVEVEFPQPEKLEVPGDVEGMKDDD